MVSSMMSMLNNIIMEQNIKSCAKHHHKWPLGQACSRPKQSTINLIALRVIKEESGLEEKTSYCSFANFKKAVDIIARS